MFVRCLRLGSSLLLSRRYLLLILRRYTRFLLTIPIAYTFPPAAVTHATTTTRSKGEDVMPDETQTVDPYRLPRHVVPTRYELRLEPDLTTATFIGQVTITLTVHQTTQTIILNAVDLVIDSARLEGQDGHRIEGTTELDHSLQRATLSLGRPISQGAWKLYLSFHGELNDQLRGFYRSTYKDQCRRWPPRSSRRPMRVGPSHVGMSLISKRSSPRRW